MNQLREAAERLASARGVPEVLAAAHAALGVMLLVIYQRQDQADGAYAAFVLAGTSVASSRMALWSAPSLPEPAVPAAAELASRASRCAARPDDAASALAGLAGLLAARLQAAAANAAGTADRAACAEAARHARAACSWLGGPAP